MLTRPLGLPGDHDDHRGLFREAWELARAEADGVLVGTWIFSASLALDQGAPGMAYSALVTAEAEAEALALGLVRSGDAPLTLKLAACREACQRVMRRTR